MNDNSDSDSLEGEHDEMRQMSEVKCMFTFKHFYILYLNFKAKMRLNISENDVLKFQNIFLHLFIIV